jgi:hypothetical protein
MSDKKNRGFLATGLMQTAAGGSAGRWQSKFIEKKVFISFLTFQGFVEVCIMHPLDLIKTRLQLQGLPTSAGNSVRI